MSVWPTRRKKNPSHPLPAGRPNNIRNMKKKPFLILLLLTCLLPSTLHGTEGCIPSTEADKACATLIDGERLSYTLFFNWKFVWIKAGEASLSTRATTYKGQKAYTSTLLGSTNKTADAIFRLRDTLTTIVRPDALPLYFVKHCQEAEDIVYERAWFSYPSANVYRAKQTKVYIDGHERNTEFSRTTPIFDMISLMQYARTFDMQRLKRNQRLVYPMVTGKKVEDQTLIYMGKQEVTTLSGKDVSCHVFSLVQTAEKGGEAELLRFFISDDERHIPIQIDIALKFGTAKAKLK